MKILVVDDDRYIIEMINFMLDGQGHDIHSFSHVDDAIAAVNDNEFDLIITDIVMPDKTGIDFMKYIKIEKGLKTPVLAMTAGLENAVDDYVSHASLYADKAIPKPLKKAEFIAIVNELGGVKT